ncbi:MAG: Clp protease N-terminal domain-containing protein, partial [Succinatimonas hippei]|nr:Clp protease N-terminal domain-containing protein [Succinatimonas hippei]
MRLDRFTAKFQEALADAQSLAIAHDNQFIEPVHIMSALLSQQDGTVRPLITLAGSDPKALEILINKAVESLPQVKGADGDLQISPQTGRLLNVSDKLSQEAGDQFISSEMFVLAAAEGDPQIKEIFSRVNLDTSKLNKALGEVRGGQKVTDENAESNRGALKKYCIDLTERAEKGKLDPVIGRDEEIR